MSQSVWHRDDIARLCESTLNLALEANAYQSSEFLRGVAAGVLAVAHSVGAPVKLPKRHDPVAVKIDVSHEALE